MVLVLIGMFFQDHKDVDPGKCCHTRCPEQTSFVMAAQISVTLNEASLSAAAAATMSELVIKHVRETVV